MNQFITTDDQKKADIKKQEELADNQVKLSDGRIVEMRESTGADEMIVSGELGDTFTANGAGAIIFQSCLIAKTVTSIDGKPIMPMRGFTAYRDFAGSFKSKDWNKIKNLYDKLNGDNEGND
jgi:hypothetical protein